MSDLLFMCPNCRQPLAIGDVAAGSAIACVSCGERVQVPGAEVAWRCDGCDAPFAAPLRLTGETFDCPSCGAAVVVPNAPATADPGSCRSCGSCGAPMTDDAVVCVRCGLDARTGNRLRAAKLPGPSASSIRRVAIPVLALSLLVAAGLGARWAWAAKRAVSIAAAAAEADRRQEDLHRNLGSLRAATLDGFAFVEAPLADVLGFLGRSLKERASPQDRLVRFEVAPAEPATPVPRITMSGRDVRLDQVLDLVAEATGSGIAASNDVVILAPGSRSASDPAIGTPAEAEKLRPLIAAAVIPEVDFRQADVREIASWLGAVAHDKTVPGSPGVSIVFVPPPDDGRTIPRITMRASEARLADVLDVVARAAGCSWTADGNVAILRPSQPANGDPPAGDGAAELAWANAERWGWLGTTNLAEAARWYRVAAERGQPEAQFLLAGSLFSGMGCRRDVPEALAWWRKAADAGNVHAQTSLAYCYLDGHGMPTNRATGMEHLRASAEDGDDVAQARLGSEVLADGDAEEALYWLQQSASAGNAGAESLLASARGQLAREALECFGTRIGDPAFAGDPELAQLANAVAKMRARTAFPDREECDELLAVCQRLSDRDLSREDQRAVLGSSILFDTEVAMLDAGFSRYGGQFMDAASIAKARASTDEKNRQVAAWRARQEEIARKAEDLRERRSAMLRSRPADTSPFKSTSRKKVQRLGGGRSSGAEQHANYQQWMEQERQESQEAENPQPSSSRSGGTTGGDAYGAYLIGQAGGTVTGSSGSTTWGVAPPGSQAYRDYMRDTFGGNVGVTANAGEFGPIINPRGINW